MYKSGYVTYVFYDGKSEKGKLKQEKDLSYVGDLHFEEVMEFCKLYHEYKNKIANSGDEVFVVKNKAGIYKKVNK